jgi:hypothetical protein
MNRIGVIISWSLVLAIPAFLFVMFWIGTGIQMGQCDSLRILEIKELITAEENIAMQIYYQCQGRPDLAKLPFGQTVEITEILYKIQSQE